MTTATQERDVVGRVVCSVAIYVVSFGPLRITFSAGASVGIHAQCSRPSPALRHCFSPPRMMRAPTTLSLLDVLGSWPVALRAPWEQRDIFSALPGAPPTRCLSVQPPTPVIRRLSRCFPIRSGVPARTLLWKCWSATPSIGFPLSDPGAFPAHAGPVRPTDIGILAVVGMPGWTRRLSGILGSEFRASTMLVGVVGGGHSSPSRGSRPWPLQARHGPSIGAWPTVRLYEPDGSASVTATRSRPVPAHIQHGVPSQSGAVSSAVTTPPSRSGSRGPAAQPQPPAHPVRRWWTPANTCHPRTARRRPGR